MRGDLAERLRALLDPEAERHGFELVAVEVAGSQARPIVRVFLDRRGGIDLDAVCEANAWISALLDAEEPIAGPYTLEVSSPGVDRPLCTIDDFERFTGSVAALKTQPIDGRTKFSGRIDGINDDKVVLDVEGRLVHIPFGDVIKARLRGEVDFGQERGDDQR